MPSGIYKRNKKHKEMIKKAMKGHIISDNTKKKIGESNKGKKRSDEFKQRCKQRMIGNIPWNKGLRGVQKGVRGKNHCNWKGGVTPENDKIRKSVEYTLWRKAIFERDNFICQKCKQLGGKLRAHHINNFADFSELRFAIDNGITLCDKCHREFHRKYGRKNNTLEQVIGFIKNL